MIFIEYQKLLEERLDGIHQIYKMCEEIGATHFIAKLTKEEQKEFKVKEFHRFPIYQIGLIDIKNNFN